ncbi:hypothetical protein ABEB36_000684 [Hypothenemus hampei]|uniref:Uncharacterized protein n=1 Tax=Hypothenemus hampei TaxID=57062 RepID=A0ABD1FC32_HYPHA
MPPIRRRDLGRKTRNATNQYNFRNNQTVEQREERNEIERNRLSQIRSGRTQEERLNANENDMHRMRHNRSFSKTIETSSKTITDSSITFENSQNLLDDFQITYEELEKLEKSLVLSSEKMNCEELKKPEESLICSFDKINFEDLNRLEECKELESGSGEKSLVDKKKKKTYLIEIFINF